MRLSIDFFASVVMGISCVLLLVVHRSIGPDTRYRRVAQQGATFFLGLNLMQAGYWMLQPLVRRCAKSGVTAAAITWLSLIPALAAAVAAATDHWGLAAWCLLASALLDVLDGAVARAAGETSAAGAVLDSALDRYAEFVFFAGLLVFYRNDLPVQMLVLAALLGSFLITYSTAKAEALHLKPPRGSMKRSDRLTILVLGTALVPFSEPWFESLQRPRAWPVVAALALIAVLANVSAIQRFAALARDAHLSEWAEKPDADPPPVRHAAPPARTNPPIAASAARPSPRVNPRPGLL